MILTWRVMLHGVVKSTNDRRGNLRARREFSESWCTFPNTRRKYAHLLWEWAVTKRESLTVRCAGSNAIRDGANIFRGPPEAGEIPDGVYGNVTRV